MKGVEWGGRFQGLAFVQDGGPREVGCAGSRIDDRCKLAALEARFGTFPDRLLHVMQSRDVRSDEALARDLPSLSAENAPSHETPAPHPSLRERAERDAINPFAPGSWALERARGIAENARLREEYGRYRDAFYEQRREQAGERRNDAWSDELAQRRVESERRWESKQTQRAVVRVLTPRGLLRDVAYGAVEHLHQRRTERERSQASARWERAKTELAGERAETRAVAPLRYRDYVRERAEAGDDGALRVCEYLDRQARGERTVPVERVCVHSIEELSGELMLGVNAAAAQGRVDARTMPTFLAQYKRQGAIETRLQALARGGVREIAVERLGSGDFEDRLGQVERALDQRERETVVETVVSQSVATPAVERNVVAESGNEADRVAPVQQNRLVSRTADEVREELRARMVEESAVAGEDARRLGALPSLQKGYERIDAWLAQSEDRGIARILVAPGEGVETAERFKHVEAALFRAGRERTDADELARGNRAAAAHERAVAALAEQPYALLRAELVEVKRRLIERDALLGRENGAFWETAQQPERDAAAEIGSARDRALADAQERARPYTPAEWEKHDEIARRTISRNPLKHVGLERLKRELADVHAERIGNATQRASVAFETSGEGDRIAERCRLANEEWAHAQERLERIARDRAEVSRGFSVVAGGAGALERLERDDIPAPVVALDRTRSPEELADRIAEQIVTARASVGYDKQRAQLDAFAKGLREREAVLERVRKALGFVAQPRPLEEQRRIALDAVCEEARKAAGLTEMESHRMFKAYLHLRDRNPLTRGMAERTHREIMNAKATREDKATEHARRTFTVRDAPTIERRFAEEHQAHATWETRCSKVAEAQREVQNGLAAVAVGHQYLRIMERVGVSWQALDRAMGARECMHASALQTQIGAAKDALTVDMGTTELRLEMEAVVRGEALGYDERERGAAAAILKQLEDLKPGGSVCVERDLHRVLATPENVNQQVREIEREQQAQELRERKRERERSRGMSMGRGM